MKLSTKGRYAMIALLDIALAKESTPISLAQIATRQGISLVYLEQLFVKLRKTGIVRSVRGMKGGYVIGRSAETIRVLEILEAVDENVDTRKSGQGASFKTTGTKAQSLSNHLWKSLATHVYVFLHNLRLSDVLENSLQPCPALEDFLSIDEDAMVE